MPDFGGNKEGEMSCTIITDNIDIECDTPLVRMESGDIGYTFDGRIVIIKGIYQLSACSRIMIMIECNKNLFEFIDYCDLAIIISKGDF